MKYNSKLISAAAILSATFLFNATANASMLVYSNDFDGNVFGSAAINGVEQYVNSGGFAGVPGSTVSGQVLRNNSGKLPGKNKAANTEFVIGQSFEHGARIEFDLLVIDSWDGNNTSAGFDPDFFNIQVNSGTKEFKETISVFDDNDGTIINNPSATLISSGSNLYGLGFYDSLYRISLDVDGSLTDPTKIKRFASGAGWQGGWDESWAIDNFKVSAVPEPSTYAMFGTAFLILGIAGYRSRNRKS